MRKKNSVVPTEKNNGVPVEKKITENIILNDEPVIEETLLDVPPEKIKETSLDEELSAFKERTTNFTPPIEKTFSQNVSPDLPNYSNVDSDIKIKMFLGFMCALISGASTWIFNLIYNHEIEFSDMKLEDWEKDSLKIYLQTPEIINFINKIPSKYICILHIGYMMHAKYEGVVKRRIADGSLKIKIKNKKENQKK